jgi:hypothetical protein
MVRPLDNQERINPPEYADRIASLKRRSEAESRDFALSMKEAVRDKEEGEEKKKRKESETPLQDSVELSSVHEDANPEPIHEPPIHKSKHDAVDIVV